MLKICISKNSLKINQSGKKQKLDKFKLNLKILAVGILKWNFPGIKVWNLNLLEILSTTELEFKFYF